VKPVVKIGVLGGTFDPPHRGHLALAEAAYQQLELDRVLWVPAGQPPHKHHRTPMRHRLTMTQLAIAGRPHFCLCRLDVDRPGPHYTVDLMALLQARYGRQTSFWFLVGEDSLRELASWHAPERLLRMCRVAVYPRPVPAGATHQDVPQPPVDWYALEKIVPEIQAPIDWLAGSPIGLASSLIRERVRRGRPIDDQVPAAVGDYIETHGLYRCM